MPMNNRPDRERWIPATQRALTIARLRNTARAIEDLKDMTGVTAYGPNRHGHLVIAESDADRIDHATHGLITISTAAAFQPTHSGFRGIPITTAPDWTCNPLAVANARMIATGAKLARLRAITRWLTKVLP
jgi:hypothetical protein